MSEINKSGISREEGRARAEAIDTWDSFVPTVARALHERAATSRPLIPIFVPEEGQLLHTLESILDHEWLNENAVIVCFDRKGEDHRWVCLALRRDQRYWLNSDHGHQNLNTSDVSSYPVRDYCMGAIEEIKKSMDDKPKPIILDRIRDGVAAFFKK